MIEEYTRGGGREVERLILEEFGVFMYNNGRGMDITRTEYLKWKYRNVTKDQVSYLFRIIHLPGYNTKSVMILVEEKKQLHK